MDFQFYLEKLKSSDIFKRFIKENPRAYLCSGFFTLDKKANDNQQHLDYFNSKSKKMFSFKLDQNPIGLLPVENFVFTEKNPPIKMPENLNFEFEEIEKLIRKRMQKEKINKNIEKILLSIQKTREGGFVIGTVFISNLGMIKISYDLQKKEFTAFQKKSFFDLLKIVKKKDKIPK